MENKKAAILVLAIVAAVAVTAGGAYAMGRQVSGAGYANYSSGTNYGYRMGPGMMGGYAGGMMGGYQGMMGNNGYSMYQYMEHYWNSTSVP